MDAATVAGAYDQRVYAHWTQGAHTHSYAATRIVEPTCTQAGYTEYTCSCGSSYVYENTEALGHCWDEGTVLVPATEEAPGELCYCCTRCTESWTEEIPILPHVHRYTTEVIAPTCTEAGYTDHFCFCGENYQDQQVRALGHDYVNGVCSRCGEEEKPILPHDDICPSRQFSDRPAYDNWAHEGIDYCVEEGLMNGVGGGLFGPGGTVTRAQLVTILYRVAGSPEAEYTGTFADVKDEKWYTYAVEWAAENGIVNGTAPGVFNPDGAITREQIAAILYRYEESPAVRGALDAFPDHGRVHSYAVDALIWATGKGLINGIRSGDVVNLAPQNNATRAQIASIIMRYLES